ncbi:MAG: hypothetical protein RMJ84_11160 [Sandaracinaceae bacterium]|nr:hypothetical protein [Sandaracinaceae bacterium]
MLWAKMGGPMPPPHLLKQGVVRQAIRRVRAHTLIETGTHIGNMVAAMCKEVKRVISIEIHPGLHQIAKNRFRHTPNVTLLLGDSAQLLPEAIRMAGESPIVFWLDGHYSGPSTGRGTGDTPIWEELNIIFKMRNAERHRDAVLIDDVNCFLGDPSYPSLEQVKERFAQEWPSYPFTVHHNMMVVLPGDV